MSESPNKNIHIVINPASGKDEPVLYVLNDVFHQYEDIEWTISVTKKYGAYTGRTPISMHVVPGALRVIVPSAEKL